MGHHADTDAGSSWRNGHPTVFLSGCPFWCANLSIDISYFIGASAKIDTSDATFIAGHLNSGDKGYHDNPKDSSRPVKRHTSDGKLLITPVLGAIFAAGLAGVADYLFLRRTCEVGWVQAQSKDLLPSYVMAPGIIGAVCAGITAVMSVFATIQLHKGNGYHTKIEQKTRDSKPHEAFDALKHKSHPFFMWHWALLGAGVALLLTVGSYCYMLLFISRDEQYCVAWQPATSIDDCTGKGNSETLVVVLLMAGTGATGALLFRLAKVVNDALEYHDYRTERFQKSRGIGRDVQRNNRSGQDDAYSGLNEKQQYSRSNNDRDDDQDSASDFGEDDDDMDRTGGYGQNRNSSRPPSYF
ncbi:hypothetical protein JCM5353_007015 [Sporobolomyces roseus]